MQTGVRILFEYLKAFRLPLTTTHSVFIIFCDFQNYTSNNQNAISCIFCKPILLKNWNAFCKLIVLDNYKISKKSKKSVLRYIENITGSVGNFVKCTYIKAISQELKPQNSSDYKKNSKNTYHPLPILHLNWSISLRTVDFTTHSRFHYAQSISLRTVDFTEF